MKRKLASIQTVHTLEAIPNADKIEVAGVLGWKCVVAKGQFKTGDLGVFIEIDSIVPPTEDFAFMKDRGYRVRTIKLRGQLSQGLMMPMDILLGKKYPTDKRDNPVYPFKEGMDVTDLLGIVKYELPLPAQIAGQIYGNFPSFIPKTDEIRLQSEPGLLDEIRNVPVYITSKVDGTSGTFYVKDGHFGVCSRNWEYKDEGNTVYWQVAKRYNLEAVLKSLDRDFAIQGEAAGPGIQRNPMGLPELDVFMFNLWDIANQEYATVQELNNVCRIWNLKMVPIQVIGDALQDETIDSMIEMAKGTYPNGHQREGIVVRPIKEMGSTILKGRLSFKVCNNDYLLAGGEA